MPACFLGLMSLTILDETQNFEWWFLNHLLNPLVKSDMKLDESSQLNGMVYVIWLS